MENPEGIILVICSLQLALRVLGGSRFPSDVASRKVPGVCIVAVCSEDSNLVFTDLLGRIGEPGLGLFPGGELVGAAH